MKSSRPFRRRSFLKADAALTFAAPGFVPRQISAPASERVFHVSFGAGGMGRAELDAIARHQNVEFLSVAEVEPARAPECRSTAGGGCSDSRPVKPRQS